MSEIIKLKVPAKPSAEYVSHGNLGTELVAGAIVETTDRRWADWLVNTHGLEELSAVSDEPSAEETERDVDLINADLYPADFPGREALIEQNVAYETAIGLDAEQLTKYKGIGPKTAGEIVEFVATGGTE